MQFRRILGLSSAFGGGQRHVFSVLVNRFFASYSSYLKIAPPGSGVGYSPSMPLWQHQESRKVPVSVWWDIETCDLPAGANAFKVAQAITTTIRSSGMRGQMSITGFGDIFNKLSMDNIRALDSTGICFQIVLPSIKTSDALVYWVSAVSPPAHIFLISSDTVFASALHRLRLKNYNILLARKTYALDNLFSAASIIWDWCSLVEGKTVTGIHFNYPPIGASHPHCGLIPLQDSFAAVEQSNSVKTEESLVPNSNLNTKESTALSKTSLQVNSYSGPSTPSDQRVGENESDNSKSPGFFNWILKWFKFWEKDATAAKAGDELGRARELASGSSQMNEFFIQESFWREIKPFINSPRGCTIVSRSMTRKRMARRLQKEGPSCLKLLSDLGMLHLVDALISEKKWVEENPFETLPFRVTQVSENSSGPGHSLAGSRSIFLNPPIMFTKTR